MNPDPLPPAQFKDRKLGLVLFGVATALAGGVCALLVPLMIFGSKMAMAGPHPPPVAPNLLPAAATYGVLAVILIWLGIGSIMARRWARALLVIWSWTWLIGGLVGTAFWLVMWPQFASAMQAAQPAGRPELSAGPQTAIMLMTLAFVGFISVFVPLIWGLFYSGKNVKATCEARDPIVRWTDRCPLPVLALSLWTAFGAFALLLMPAFHTPAPFFGVLLSGVAGGAFYFFVAVVWAYCAWALYRLDRRGWWVIVATMILFGLSNVVTYSRHDISEMYAAMGYPPSQLDQFRKLGLMGGTKMAWVSLLGLLPFLGYLVYIRKFFTDLADERTGGATTAS